MIALIAVCMHVDHQHVAKLSQLRQNSIALTVNPHVSHRPVNSASARKPSALQ